jgi:hypothetical protein
MDNLFDCSTLIQQNSTLIEPIYRLNGAIFYLWTNISDKNQANLNVAHKLGQ